LSISLAQLRSRGTGEHGVLAAVLLAVGVIAALRTPVFLSSDNLLEILQTTSTYFIIGCGATLLMIAGGIDFSVGATFTVGAVVACGLMSHGLIWPVAIRRPSSRERAPACSAERSRCSPVYRR
jgi:ribose/xylose/arabinose/galactoside ABC-type transport system permease subunit